jgi:truncated hemoglobin YjbI
MFALLSRCKQPANCKKKKNRNGNRTLANQVPHAIPEGMEDAVCPVTGLSLEGHKAQMSNETAAAFIAMESDPDILEERLTRRNTLNIPIQDQDAQVTPPQSFEFVPLNVRSASHQANAATQRLVRSVGLKKLREFTEAFYAKVFVDPHLDKFIRRHDDPHGERFALWIAEKFGDGTPWTEERKTRPKDLMRIGREIHEVAHDRSSAHFAAWHSPKREAHKWGQHFKPDDARVWMRLHFWAAREVGLFEPQYASFMDYYIRFIGHFVSVYSGKSPPFTRESARWSADPQNTSRYVEAGRLMIDVIDMPVEKALATLPTEEQEYTGSKHPNPSWPYQKKMQ